ncbi:MAG TPA: CBS domain-containing protein [Bacillota bacterium]|nr:CBS domain-containing protein [Bacillota bacterium]
MELTQRQQKIVDMVKHFGPIAAEDLASRLDLTRAAIRADLSVLTMLGHLEARPRVGYTYAGREGIGLHAEKLRSILVRDIQAVPIVIREGVSLYEAIVTTLLEDDGTMFVTDNDGRLVGVVSRGDLLRAAIGQTDLNKVPVGILMTRMANLITLTGEDTLLTAARKLSSHRVNAVPVVRKSDKSGGFEVTGTVNLSMVAALVAEFAEKH